MPRHQQRRPRHVRPVAYSHSAAFRPVAKGADLAVGAGGAFDPRGAAFGSAEQCMRKVDGDRLLWAREAWAGPCDARLGQLEPPSCSPRNSVILLRPAPAADPTPAGCACAPCAPCAPAAACRGGVPLFGGLGACGGQMRELRRVANGDARVAALLGALSSHVADEVARWAPGEPTWPYEHGVDFRSWCVGPDSRDASPPRAYLDRLNIGAPLLTAAQLCNYYYAALHPPDTGAPLWPPLGSSSRKK